MIIGIGGISRSGKSTLAKEIKAQNPQLLVSILSQDDYVFPEDKIPTINGLTDWERPESINFVLFEKAIKESSKNNDITIAEGLMVFYDHNINALFNKKIFIEIDKQTFLNRKSSDLRWGSIPEWYSNHIWDSFIQFGTIDNSNEKYLLIDGTNKMNYNAIKNYLK